MLTIRIATAGILALLAAATGCVSDVTQLKRPTAGVASPVHPDFEIAIAIDDLPHHGLAIPGVSRTQIASQMLETLIRHRVPQVYGFVNGFRLANSPSERAVLTAWLNAGYPLGNHTYSHVDMRRVALVDFISDVERNETVLAQEMDPTRVVEWKVLDRKSVV